MSPSRIAAIARRIAQGFRRDERTLALMFVVPLVITALLGWVLRDTNDTLVRVMVVNEAGAPGQRIVDALTEATIGAPDGIEVVSFSDPDQAEPGFDLREGARQQLRDDNIDLGLVLPSTLVDDVLAGRRPVITVITKGVEPGADADAFGKLQALMATVARELVPPGAQPPVIPQVAHETVYLSPDADQVDVFAPIFLGFFGYFFVFLLTGVSFLRERIGGTLERLVATPVTRAEIVLGYSLGFGTFATIQIAFLTVFILNSFQTPELGPIPSLTIGLGVDAAGSPYLAFLIALLLSIGAVNLGIFLSTFARTELQVIQFIPLVIVPQGLLSGLLWPVEKLPDVLQAIAHVLPLTYAVDGLREVMLKGADLSNGTVQVDLVVLAGIALFFVALASTTIKREVA
ncbi:MAG TPA: ABC transporter permease [Candidatus Limnocylindrales bacterium]|nr:ABC transporter permease [Candidatus Limnocylindrales bacterium]